MKLVFALLLLLVSVKTHAYDCNEEKQRIIADLSEDVQCTQDVECGYFNYGYPWQPDICMKAIINVKKDNKNISNLRLIAEYNNNCIYTNEDEKKKFKEFEEKLATASETCNEPVRVYCYKGFCRTLSYAIYNDE